MSAITYTQHPLVLPSLGRGSHLITPFIQSSLKKEIDGIQCGLLHLFVQHTSCALSLNENWDEDVRKDMSDALDKIVVEDKVRNLLSPFLFCFPLALATLPRAGSWPGWRKRDRAGGAPRKCVYERDNRCRNKIKRNKILIPPPPPPLFLRKCKEEKIQETIDGAEKRKQKTKAQIRSWF